MPKRKALYEPMPQTEYESFMVKDHLLPLTSKYLSTLNPAKKPESHVIVSHLKGILEDKSLMSNKEKIEIFNKYLCDPSSEDPNTSNFERLEKLDRSGSAKRFLSGVVIAIAMPFVMPIVLALITTLTTGQLGALVTADLSSKNSIIKALLKGNLINFAAQSEQFTKEAQREFRFYKSQYQSKVADSTKSTKETQEDEKPAPKSST